MIFAYWRFRLLASTLVLLVTLGVTAGEFPTWPPASEGLPPAPEWTLGRLDNGLRYALRRNSRPAGHVSLRLVVGVGFAHEEPEEAGLAHFIEHMVFNGTRRYPGTSLIAEMQRRGVALGPDLSAFTFLTHTLYQLDAPSASPKDLRRWFGVLRDFADGATFDVREVRQERKVIASELRDRVSVGTRAERERRRILYPASIIGRADDGDPARVDPAALRRFYGKWYRPDRMLLVAVGDVEPAMLEATLREEFSTLEARGAAPVVRLGPIGNPPEGKFHTRHDAQAGVVSIETTSVLPVEDSDSPTRRRLWLAQQLALEILNDRLAVLTRQHSKRLSDAAARSLMPTPFSIETTVTVQTPALDWHFGVETLEQELRRSLEFAFTPAEIREAAQTMLMRYETSVTTAATQTSSDLANQATAVLTWGIIPTSAETELALVRDDLATLDAAEVSDAWRALWPPRRATVIAYGFLPYRGATTMLATTYQRSAESALDAPKSAEIGGFAYRDFGPPGELTHREHDAAIDVHLLGFANGVRLNLKPLTSEAGTVQFVARLGRGMLGEPPDKPGLGQLVHGAFLAGALGRHKPEELSRLVSARAVQLGFYVEEDSFTFRGKAARRDLEHALESIAAYLTDPGWDEEAFSHARVAYIRHATSQFYSPEGMLGLHVYRTLSGGDTRYSLASEAQYLKRSVQEARDWMGPQLRSAPLEIGLVGDLDVEETIALVARTLGALPARTDDAAEVRPVRLAKTAVAGPKDFRFPGEPNRAGLQVVWPLSGCGDIVQSRRLEVLTAILQDRLRLKVREEMGAAYVPTVTFWKSDACPEDGYLTAYLSAKPREISKLAKLLRRLAHQLALQGVTADELLQAREPLLARSVIDPRDNDYWSSHIIGRMQSHPEVRSWPLTREPQLRAMTVAEINALAREILREDAAIVFTAAPVKR